MGNCCARYLKGRTQQFTYCYITVVPNDALEDVRALHKILFHSITTEVNDQIVNNNNLKLSTHAPNSMQLLGECFE